MLAMAGALFRPSAAPAHIWEWLSDPVLQPGDPLPDTVTAIVLDVTIPPGWRAGVRLGTSLVLSSGQRVAIEPAAEACVGDAVQVLIPLGALHWVNGGGTVTLVDDGALSPSSSGSAESARISREELETMAPCFNLDQLPRSHVLEDDSVCADAHHRCQLSYTPTTPPSPSATYLSHSCPPPTCPPARLRALCF